MKPLRILVVFIGVAAGALLAASCGGDAWARIIKKGENGRIGLWRYCVDDEGTWRCGSSDDLSGSLSQAGWYKRVRGLSVTAIVIAFGATFIEVMTFLPQKHLPGIAAAAFLGAGIVAISGLAEFTVNTKSALGAGRFEWSFALGWVGAAMCLGNFILALLVAKTTGCSGNGNV